MTTTLHIENTVHDYDSWKAAFDKYERMRADKGVLTYRILRRLEEPNKIAVDLEFADEQTARDFREQLFKIWQTPQSRDQLLAHGEPQLYERVVNRVLADSVSG